MNSTKNEKYSKRGVRKNSEEIETLFQKQSEVIPIEIKPKELTLPETFEITSSQLENTISSYTDFNNKTTLLENLEVLGGTKGILQKLKSSIEEGIQPSSSREELFGSNKIFEEPPAPFIKFLKESLSELMIVILLSAAIIQIIIGLTISDQKKTGWFDGASVLFAVFVVVS